jgi:hypothetical protein
MITSLTEFLAGTGGTSFKLPEEPTFFSAFGAGDEDRTRNFQLGNVIQAVFVYSTYTNA